MMSDMIEIKVPDIGDFEGVEVIEVLVQAGDVVEAEQPLISLESDKATMEVPSPQAGTIGSINVSEGDKVSEGDVIGTLEAGDSEPSEESNTAEKVEEAAPESPAEEVVESDESDSSPAPQAAQEVAMQVPDIGDFDAVEVIEVLVSEGDEVEVEQPLITLESDKATMEVPAPSAGTIKRLSVKEGDRVAQGDEIGTLITGSNSSSAEAAETNAQPSKPAGKPAPTQQPSTSTPSQSATPLPAKSAQPVDHAAFKKAHASPSVRAYARELGVDLSKVTGSGRKERITKEDVQKFVKGVMAGAGAPAAASGAGIPPVTLPDYSKFGEIETVELPRIRKLSAAHLHKCWLNVPHVTQFDDADITELEAFRQAEKNKHDVKLTPLAFIMKACALGLLEFPDFNAAITTDGGSLIRRKYMHIGFAADTPNGLVVPVVRDADKKGILQIAKESGELAAKAREGKLGPADMQGGCFSISSLGGIGGTAFTPIVNAPEVAILGVSKSSMQPVWDGKEFQPRLVLPLSLSYDHRVIDGAAAARFTGYLAEVLGDIRQLLL